MPVLEPVGAKLPCVKALYQAERVVDVLGLVAEVITVVVVLELQQRIVVGDSLFVGEITHRLFHVPFQLGLRDAADGRVPWHHRDVLEVVQLAEYAELGELVYPRDEHEPPGTGQGALDRAIEVSYIICQASEASFSASYSSIIMTALLAGIFDSRFDKTLKSRVDVIFRDSGIRTPLLLVFG